MNFVETILLILMTIIFPVGNNGVHVCIGKTIENKSSKKNSSFHRLLLLTVFREDVGDDYTTNKEKSRFSVCFIQN